MSDRAEKAADKRWDRFEDDDTRQEAHERDAFIAGYEEARREQAIRLMEAVGKIQDRGAGLVDRMDVHDAILDEYNDEEEGETDV